MIAMQSSEIVQFYLYLKIKCSLDFCTKIVSVFERIHCLRPIRALCATLIQLAASPSHYQRSGHDPVFLYSVFSKICTLLKLETSKSEITQKCVFSAACFTTKTFIYRITNTKKDAGCFEVGARYLTELLASAPLYERTEIRNESVVCLLKMESGADPRQNRRVLPPNGAAAS